MKKMDTSSLSTFHIDERNVRNDWYFEIWWAEAKEAPEGDYWKDSDFIVVFYDSDGEEKPIGVLLEADIKNITMEMWKEIWTLQELPVRFNYKDYTNLTLPQLINLIIKDINSQEKVSKTANSDLSALYTLIYHKKQFPF